MLRKIIAAVVALVMAWAAVVPSAHAARLLQEVIEEIPWLCVATSHGCPDPNDPMTPFEDTYIASGGGSALFTEKGASARPYCTPFPECAEGLEVFFLVYVKASWSIGYGGYPDTTVTVNVNVYEHVSLENGQEFAVGCGTGQSGGCEAWLSGSIIMEADPLWGNGVLKAYAVGFDSPDVAFQSSSLQYYVFFSTLPFTDCEEVYTVSTDEFEIDPTIEFPVGPSVVPGDDQIFSTVPDQTYKVYVSGGPVNDGSVDRDDVEFSWDGEIWYALDELESDCSLQMADGQLVLAYYLVAESSTFYIRFDDAPGAYADNYNNPDPLVYHIDLVFLESDCTSQYEYDEFDDVVGYTGVDSTLETGVHLNNVEELVVGEWYMIKYFTGDWTDNGGEEQIDVEYNWLPHTTGWSDLSEEGGDAVWCQTSDGYETLFQAHATNIFLRANDADSDFENNEGTVYYTIFHVTFNRKPEACELTVNMGSLIESIIVDADKWNGSPVGTAMEVTIQPGGWYVLDTTLGPWRQTTGSDRYDMAIKDEPAGSAEGTWIELEEFEATCNIEIDTLGHRRIIFQAPDDYAYDGSQGHYYRLRVDREFLGLYLGSMGWQLYGASPVGGTVDTCLDGLNLQVINEFEWIDEKDGMGEVLLSDNIRWPEYTALVPGITYVVQSPVDAIGQCAGDAGSECKFQVSNDNGATWYEVDDLMSPLECAVKDDTPSNIWKGRFTMQEGEMWRIRVNDMDGNFLNNTGATAFKFFKDCSGEDCIPLDEDELPAISVQGGGDVCKIAIMRPGPLNAEALINLGTYLGNWIQYLNLSVLRYMAWCPRHTGVLTSFYNSLRNKEPFASVAEMDDMQERVKDEIESYDWGENAGQAESIFEMTASGELGDTIQDRVFGNSSERSVWEGGELVLFDDNNLPESYYSCNTAFTNALPSGLRTGVCFVSAYFIETSASFWIQLLIDISAVFAAIVLTKNAVIDLVYIFTGIQLRRQPTQAEIGRTIRDDEIGQYMRRRK